MNNNSNINNLDKEKRKSHLRIAVFVCMFLVSIGMIVFAYIEYNKNGAKLYYSEAKIIHNNKYYSFEKTVSKNIINLYETNLNGDGEHKLLCENVFTKDDLNSDTFKYIKGNELYFYNQSEPLKINIETCEVKGVDSDIELQFSKVTHDIDGYIYLVRYKKDNSTLTKIDKTNYKIVDSKAMEYTPFIKKIIDYDNLIVYKISNNKNQPFIKKDEEVIYDLPFVELLDITDNDLIIVRKNEYNFNCIYKVSIDSTDRSESEIYCDENNDLVYNMIPSDTNDRYFYRKDTIYRYNKETNKIETITKFNISGKYSVDASYHINDKVIFLIKKDKNSDDPFYKSDKYAIIVYGTKSKQSKIYDRVSLFNFDNGKFAFDYMQGIITVE